MSFYPSVENVGHIRAEKQLAELCLKNHWRIADVPAYYLHGKNYLKADFSEESLKQRSLPDKFISTSNNFYIVDLKSTSKGNLETGNIAVELSSYYFSWKIYNSLYGYVAANGKLKFFSPANNNPHTLIIQPCWITNKFFLKATHELKTKTVNSLKVICKTTQGSNDPFVLIKKDTIIPTEIG